MSIHSEKKEVIRMLKRFIPSLVLVAVGAILVTFSMTKQMNDTMLWILFIGGTVINLVGILFLYIRFQQFESSSTTKKEKTVK